jgi:hypothetical protein
MGINDVRAVMTEYKNPFEYEAASKLSPEMIRKIYIEDYNYTRFIESKRNVFLLGERGSGKSMTLLYNSFKVKNHEELKNNKPAKYEYIGIYVPCNTPLFHKKEYELFIDEFHQSILSEHCLCLSMAFELFDALSLDQTFLDKDLSENLKEEFKFIFNADIPGRHNFFEAIKLFLQNEVVKTQKIINKPLEDELYDDSVTFPTLILPLLRLLKKIPALSESHFMFFIDDGHDLNPIQKKLVNSWIAYREHSLLSFKVAAASKGGYNYLTTSGGTIVEGHDFLIIDLENFFYNMESPFGKLAKELLQKRLDIFNINVKVEDFFPENEQFVKDMELSRELAKAEAKEKIPNATPKQINDYVYKYYRVIYFRNRGAKSNLPPYSGLEVIINLSTGVIRNLLNPCYWMFDRCYSTSRNKTVNYIPPNVQNAVIRESSENLWKGIPNLYRSVRNCTQKQAEMVRNLFNNLAILFKERLKRHKSEPRAIVFTISALDEDLKGKIFPLLDIATSAQILYQRSSTAKDYGDRETYYVPSRMLWPIRGLDPVGQHARVSLKAIDVWHAANGKQFPYVEENEAEQLRLFNE